MSAYDFTPADDAAMSASFDALIEHIDQRIGVIDDKTDRLLLEARYRLAAYHQELIMRRQETRALVDMVDALKQDRAA